MLIEFSIENVLSFGEPRTFSFVASAAKEHRDTHVFPYSYPEGSRAKDIPLLKSAVVYGANASGKSNLIKAMSFMRSFIKNSSRETQISDKIPVQPFRLNTSKKDSPSYFEMVFIQDGVRYRYGFRLDDNVVHNEWLYHAPKGKEAYLFEREKREIKINRVFKEGHGIEEKTRSNALFLSVCAQFNGPTSSQIVDWFNALFIIEGINERPSINQTMEICGKPGFRTDVVEFLKMADLGISDLSLQKIKYNSKSAFMTAMAGHLKESASNLFSFDIENIAEYVTKKLIVIHDVFDEKHQPSGTTEFDYHDESSGTIRMISLAAPIIYSLKEGTPLIIDELDARLHPLLTTFIINLFNANQSNPNNAQLLFTTHDTNLLSHKIFRRDQIWFTEKNSYGVSDLYSLADFKPVRKDAPFAKEYIQGKYGAIPFIGDIETLIGDWIHHG